MKRIARLLLAAAIIVVFAFVMVACDSTKETTKAPTLEPTLEPTATPTLQPTAEPTLEPTATPSPTPVVLPTADMLDVDFTSGSAVDKSKEQLPLYDITHTGNPVIENDETLNKTVGKTTFENSFVYMTNQEWYDKLADDMTVELYVYIPAEQEYGNLSYTDIFSSMNAGGFGFEIHKTAGLQFWVHTGSYNSISTMAFVTDQWNHLVATFDGSTIVLYINGEYINEIETTAAMTPPTDQTFALCVGADIGSVSRDGVPRMGPQSNSNFAFARMYNKAYNANVVKAMYDAAIESLK